MAVRILFKPLAFSNYKAMNQMIGLYFSWKEVGIIDPINNSRNWNEIQVTFSRHFAGF